MGRDQHEFCRPQLGETIERLATSICSVVIEMDEEPIIQFSDFGTRILQNQGSIGSSELEIRVQRVRAPHFVHSCFLNGDLPF